MPTLDITDDDAARIEALREELAAAHAGPYASVDREDALAYLLDLADAVDDPDRVAEPPSGDRADETPDDAENAAAAAAPFDRDRARDLLTARNRRRSDPDLDDPMDLSDIAAAFEITGRSEMTKGELVDAVLDAAETLADDPFARVDVDLRPAEDPEDDEADDDEAGAIGDDGNEDNASEDGAGEGDADGGNEDEGADGGAGQLNAMMSLLDTHGDKWREADGDARYEVDLPDGSVETARTKDDVRALLFRNY
ncbi:hypothetical protein C464_09502 [Halorubrum coriense DSM 10284]|uniref:Rho termination factor N-terminal domain-containing protein n=1 Tax=Halorubrum coriense DSM 10284 TaxID=1227466 RepID=M0EHA8_9EURY|nr:hypothetical protein [Halorubrum coriense]ELZ47156.1 hypothetical protein C464_09502 [Halorubrum coriense DSM 10284]